MFQKVFLVMAVLVAGPVGAASVTPEIARDCAAKWGTDYSMQVYCRDKQMAALNQLSEQDGSAGEDVSLPVSADQFDYADTIADGVNAANRVVIKKGLSGLNRAVDKCYDGVKNIDNLSYCIALDVRASSLTGEAGRNSSKATVRRIGRATILALPTSQADAFATYAIRTALAVRSRS